MHQESQTTVTTTATEATALESAIAQTVLQHQQEQAEAGQAERQAAEQKAIARFQLPFDQKTLNALPTFTFRFEGETSELKTPCLSLPQREGSRAGFF